MDTPKVTPDELDIAKAVDDLVLDAGNLKCFREEIEVFRKELLGRPPEDGPYRPGDHPSRPMMFALLAYSHDTCLKDSPAIFDPPISTPLKALQHWKNVRPLWIACSSYLASKEIAPIRAATLEGYLKRVRAWLEEDARQGGGGAALSLEERHRQTLARLYRVADWVGMAGATLPALVIGAGLVWAAVLSVLAIVDKYLGGHWWWNAIVFLLLISGMIFVLLKNFVSLTSLWRAIRRRVFLWVFKRLAGSKPDGS